MFPEKYKPIPLKEFAPAKFIDMDSLSFGEGSILPFEKQESTIFNNKDFLGMDETQSKTMSESFWESQVDLPFNKFDNVDSSSVPTPPPKAPPCGSEAEIAEIWPHEREKLRQARNNRLEKGREEAETLKALVSSPFTASPSAFDWNITLSPPNSTSEPSSKKAKTN